jgi:hypothetical protein
MGRQRPPKGVGAHALKPQQTELTELSGDIPIPRCWPGAPVLCRPARPNWSGHREVSPTFRRLTFIFSCASPDPIPEIL